jgi:hypothetical protein
MNPTPPASPPPAKKHVPAPPSRARDAEGSGSSASDRNSPSTPAAADQRPASRTSSRTAAADAPFSPTAGGNTSSTHPKPTAPAPPPAAKPNATSTTAATSSASGTGRTSAAYETAATLPAPSRLAAGNALALARQADDVQQDVEFYQLIAQELPDSPALQSLLYTHRNVLGDGPNCDEELAKVDSTVQSYLNARRQRVATDRALEAETSSRGVAEAKETEGQRQRDLDAVLARMNDAFTSIDQLEAERLERQQDSVARQRRRDDHRREAENAHVVEYCASLDKFESERRARILAIDHADQRGKVEIEETLHRGLCLTAEARGRLNVAEVCARDHQAVRLFEEAVRVRRQIVEEERVACYEWIRWAEHLAQRCQHQTVLARVRADQRAQLEGVEQGQRALVVLEENRGWVQIVLEAIELGVQSNTRRRVLDETLPSVLSEPPATTA